MAASLLLTSGPARCEAAFHGCGTSLVCLFYAFHIGMVWVELAFDDDAVSYLQLWKSKLAEVMAWGTEPPTFILGVRHSNHSATWEATIRRQESVETMVIGVGGGLAVPHNKKPPDVMMAMLVLSDMVGWMGVEKTSFVFFLLFVSSSSSSYHHIPPVCISIYIFLFSEFLPPSLVTSCTYC